MPTLKEFCKQKGINYSALAEYHYRHQELTTQELIQHFLEKKQQKTKPHPKTNTNTISKPTSFKQKCKLAGIKYNTAVSYKRRHPELTDEQVIEYYLTHKNGS